VFDVCVCVCTERVNMIGPAYRVTWSMLQVTWVCMETLGCRAFLDIRATKATLELDSQAHTALKVSGSMLTLFPLSVDASKTSNGYLQIP